MGARRVSVARQVYANWEVCAVDDASGDPRPSLQERYGTHEKYVTVVGAAAARLVRERFLLPQDADRLIAEADASSVLKK